MDGSKQRGKLSFEPLPINVPDFHSYVHNMAATTISVMPTASPTLGPVWAAKHPPPPPDWKSSDPALADGKTSKLGPGWAAKHPPPPTRVTSSAHVEKIVRSLMHPDQDDRPPWQQPLEQVSFGVTQPVIKNDTIFSNGTASLPVPAASKLPGHSHGTSVLTFTATMLAGLTVSNFILAMMFWHFVRRSNRRPWHTFTCMSADQGHRHTWRLPYHPNPLYIVLFFALTPLMIARTLLVLPVVWFKYVTEARFGVRIGKDAVTLLMPGFWKMEYCCLCAGLDREPDEEPQSPDYTRDYGWGTFSRLDIITGELAPSSHLSLI